MDLESLRVKGLEGDLDKLLLAGPTASRAARGGGSSNERRWFIRGPIPEVWVARAFTVSSRALVVGLVLWKLAGMRKGKTVRLSAAASRLWGLSRSTRSRALHDLEAAGLVRVQRLRGRMAVVTILPAK